MQNKKNILPEIYNFLQPKQTNNLIRMGIKKDGGYIIDKTTLDKVNHLVSFGMANEFSFETDFLNYQKSNKIQIYDHTVNHKNYLLKILKVFRRLITLRRNVKQFINEICDYYNYIKFIYNINVKFLSLKITNKKYNDNEISFSSIISDIDNSVENIGLKIDIEGDEYKLIDDICNKHKKINFLIIEFHKIDQNKDLFLQSTKKLNQIFDIIHLHGNNHESVMSDGFPNVVEISFANKNNNLNYIKFPNALPIEGLDFPNNPHVPDIKLYFKV